MTKIINLFGGPGCGKSTIAAGLFSRMNIQFNGEKSVELVTEYAKDLTWEKRYETLRNQFYISGKQFRNLQRVIDHNVDYVITDSPLLLSEYYGRKFTPDYPEAFYEFLHYLDDNYLGDKLNIFLNRTHPYQEIGRNQTEEEAGEVDVEIYRMLRNKYGHEGFHTIRTGEDTINEIMELVQ